MSTLTIRIDELLKKQASQKARNLNVSLSFIIKNALRNFIKNPKIVIGEIEDLEVTPDIQDKMDNIGTLLIKKNKTT